MAYKRWSNSNWYIFWVAGFRKHKHQESLACWYTGHEEPDLSYLEVKSFLGNPNWKYWRYQIHPEEQQELLGVMRQWIEEVDQEWVSKKSKRTKKARI